MKLCDEAVDNGQKQIACLCAASLGAMGVAGGVVALFALLAWVSTPTPGGGIDGDHAMIAYIGVAIPLLAIAAVHVVYARQLARYAKEQQDRG